MRSRTVNGKIFFSGAILALAAGLAQRPLHAIQAPAEGMQQGPPAGDPHSEEERAAERQALGFLGYLDHGRYADSYAYTGMLSRAQLNREAFAKELEHARAGVGALLSRNLTDAAYATTVAGAPAGEYVVLHYAASFANRQDAMETVTLAFAKGYWRVSGYYIK